MGIKGLSKFIKSVAPNAYKEHKINNYHGYSYLFKNIYVGRKIAIDISMCLYQFMVAIRANGDNLKDNEGQVTRYKILIIINVFSHITGLFFRTIRLIENGIKPM